MSEQGGPEAWQKLWSMWMPSTTDAAGAGMQGGAAGSPWPQGAASPFPPMPPGFPGALAGGFPGAFPPSFTSAMPGFPPGFPGFPGMPGGTPGASAAFPFGGLGSWGPMAALAAMAPGAPGMPGAASDPSGATDPLSAVFNAPFAGLSPSLSMMSEMIAPLTQVDELDKRIADLRAVEHWLKLNLQMLQSTTQALEVQRATLATLRAFGAASAAVGEAAAKSMREGGAGAEAGAAKRDASAEAAGEAMAAGLGAGMAAVPALDPQRWWAMLNDQFQQMAAAAASVAPTEDKTAAPDASASSSHAEQAPARASGDVTGATGKRGDTVSSHSAAATAAASGRAATTPTTAKQPTKPVSKRSPPRPATVSKTANGTSPSTASGGRATGTRARVSRKPRSPAES